MNSTYLFHVRTYLIHKFQLRSEDSWWKNAFRSKDELIMRVWWNHVCMSAIFKFSRVHVLRSTAIWQDNELSLTAKISAIIKVLARKKFAAILNWGMPTSSMLEFCAEKVFESQESNVNLASLNSTFVKRVSENRDKQSFSSALLTINVLLNCKIGLRMYIFDDSYIYSCFSRFREPGADNQST